MDIETKIRKLGLTSLDDHKRYAFALNKDKWESTYKKYDYFNLDRRGGIYFYSTEYLNKHSYRYLKHKWKEANFKTFKTRIDLLTFKLDVGVAKLKYKIRMMIG